MLYLYVFFRTSHALEHIIRCALFQICLQICFLLRNIHSVIHSYHTQAIVENQLDFEGKTVVDVGAGSGILSLFAAKVSIFLGALQD